MMTSPWAVTAPTSFICYKARLVTNIPSFMCLHNKYAAKSVTNTEIIAATNRITSKMKLPEKKFLLGIFVSVEVCLSS